MTTPAPLIKFRHKVVQRSVSASLLVRAIVQRRVRYPVRDSLTALGWALGDQLHLEFRAVPPIGRNGWTQPFDYSADMGGINVMFRHSESSEMLWHTMLRWSGTQVAPEVDH